MLSQSRRLLFLLSSALLVGCSGGGQLGANISGKVTYRGTPLPAGLMAFHSKDAGIYTCAIKSDGTYAAADLPTGELRVTIETESLKPTTMPTYGAGQGGPGGKGGSQLSPVPESASGAGKQSYVKIPARYADPKKSPLTVTLAKGSQSQDFELTD